MDLGHSQIQIFVGVLLILAAALAALICDLLKGNNESLRELTVELKTRRDEEERRLQILLHKREQSLKASQEPVNKKATGSEKKQKLAPLAETAPAKAATPQDDVGAASSKRASLSEEAPVPRKTSRLDGMNLDGRRTPAAAMAAMERGARRAGALPGGDELRELPGREQQPAPVQVQEVQVQEVQVQAVVEAASPAPAADVVPAVALTGNRPAVQAAEVQQAPVEATTHEAPVRKFNWQALLEKASFEKKPEVAMPVQETFAEVPETTETPTASEPILPKGLQDGHVLAQLVKSRQPVTGLVVSIGITGRVPENISGLIRSLLGPNDFAARSSSEEFLLIYPYDRGAAAQRRLSLVAEQLWDFQLRSLGSLSVQFSWGGVEVLSESIEEAIASATERMQETRRSRGHLREEPLRQAV